MKWFKQLKEFFSSKDDEEYFYEEVEETIVQEDEEINQFFQYEQSDNIEKKKSFRFPIIDDAEIKDPNHQNESKFKKNSIHTEVYDIDQPKIRELLENRRKKIKYSYNVTYKPKTLKVQDQIIQPKFNKKKIEKVELKEPAIIRKKFTPTDVPSPIYGFQKKSSLEKKKEEIDDLKNEKLKYEQEVASTLHVDNNQTKTVQTLNFSSEDEKTSNYENFNVTKQIEKNSETMHINTEGNKETYTKNEDVQIEKNDFPKVENDYPNMISSTDQSNVQIEEDFVELELEEELYEEDNSYNETLNFPEQVVEESIEENLISEEEQVKESTGSKLPFNVLMLKSDKEKLAQKHFDNTTTKEQTLIKNQEIVKVEEYNHNDSVEESHFSKPSIRFLTPPEEKIIDQEWMESQAEKLIEALSYFQITAEIQSIMQGPAVTQFEITVAHGIKVSKIRNLADDLKLALAAKDIRIQAPIPGKSTIGIEIPNRISRAVRLSEVVTSESFLKSDSPLEAALGLDLTGKPVTIDLRKMPHGLIAGATGSGKSVCINSILVSLLYKADPNELKLMLIDPKMVELAPFNNIPHLVSPVITDVKAATAALKWAVEEMERRYQLFAQSGVRDLTRFNKFAISNNEQTLPYILIVIDELADLMMMSPADVEEAICRIAQKARACGIHLIVATQRPSVDVITGLIKSNIPTRIAFAVSSQIDSRTILDQQGAERLLGRGDMLYLGNGMSAPIRIQGTFVTDDEIELIVDFIKEQGEPNYFFEQEELLKKTEMVEEFDELFEDVCRFIAEQGSASTSLIQRKYHIGYNRAARLIDMLEQQGFISEQRGSKPREVYITESDLASMFKE